MSKNGRGVRSYVTKQAKRGNGYTQTVAFLDVIINDPCVHCGELGCDSFDHITPVSKKEELNTGNGLYHWTNLAPAHAKCNSERGNRSILEVITGVTFNGPNRSVSE